MTKIDHTARISLDRINDFLLDSELLDRYELSIEMPSLYQPLLLRSWILSGSEMPPLRGRKMVLEMTRPCHLRAASRSKSRENFTSNEDVLI